MKKKSNLLLSLTLCLCIIMSCVVIADASTFYAPKKLTMHPGYTANLLKGSSKGKVTWKSSNKKIVTVSKNGVVVAKKAGKAVITTKKGKKKYKTTVTVKNKDWYISKITCDKNNIAKTYKGRWDDESFHQEILVDVFVKNAKYDVDYIYLSFINAANSDYFVSYSAYAEGSKMAEDDNYYEKIDDTHYRVHLKRLWRKAIPGEKYVLECVSFSDVYSGYLLTSTRMSYYAGEYLKTNMSIIYQ